ncbi:MAG: hypothetical protein FWB73_04520 [Treponema sp.]|nr:hypothetical protein [Treponema sp.]
MRKYISIFILLLMAVMISVSCKSTPDTKTLNETMKKAETARQRAIDFEGPAYFPSEWETVEARYKTAGQMPLTSEAEVKEAENAYDKLAESYDDIFARTVPLYAQAREDEILEIRETLVDSGFTSYFPEYLEETDKIALSAKDEYNRGNYYQARDKAAKAMEEYEILLAGANVYTARQEVLDRGFVKYDADNFSRADQITKAAIDDYEAGNKKAAVEKSEEALLRYNLVLSNGWSAYAKERQNSAQKERELAIAERANIASREIFREAEVFYTQAQEQVNAKNISGAALQYTEAEARYSLARKDTAEKRVKADDAIKRAEVKIVESTGAAQEADRVIGEGGAR